jgi:hypothetical protein
MHTRSCVSTQEHAPRSAPDLHGRRPALADLGDGVNVHHCLVSLFARRHPQQLTPHDIHTKGTIVHRPTLAKLRARPWVPSDQVQRGAAHSRAPPHLEQHAAPAHRGQRRVRHGKMPAPSFFRKSDRIRLRPPPLVTLYIMAAMRAAWRQPRSGAARARGPLGGPGHTAC